MRVLTICLAICVACGASAQDWQAFERPGVVALMRHALAPGTGDPADFRLDDCATQRTLNADGRDQARRIGKILEDRGISFDSIWTSQWCRARETAELLDLGEVSEVPALHSFFAGRGDRESQTDTIKQALAALPANRRPLLVTHQVNITALTGEGVRSGEIILVEISPEGGITTIGRVLIEP